MATYHLTATFPPGYEAVSEAEKVEKTTGNGATVFRFFFPYPLDSINLIATNRYKVVKEDFHGIEIYAYFFREDADLIPTYLEHAKKYLLLYKDLIFGFPYKRFSIVENFLPTGYSMPTFTLLGQEVVRLPFIPETSLGHEILHQWFGNLVYIDYSKGNWAEGLTTFLADHLYQEEKGHGPEYRKEALINYESYVHEKNEFPLKGFRERTNQASEAIGYGKALMVFEMAEVLIGKERFYDAIRYFTNEMRFKRASWDDLRRAFEKYYQKDLEWFFNQWVDEQGLPDLILEEVEISPSGDRFEVAFTIQQRKKVYVLELPIIVSSSREKVKNVFHVSKEKERFVMSLDNLPEKIAVDGEYEVARRLSTEEFPPVLSRLIGDEKPIIVLPPAGVEIYGDIIHAFGEKGASVKETHQVTLSDLMGSSIIILGFDNPLVERLFGSLSTQAGFSVIVKENPWNAREVVGIFGARSKEEVVSSIRKLFHYGKYSVLFFNHGTNVYKKMEETSHGITKRLLKQPVAVDMATLQGLPAVVERAADKKIIFVGEAHDQFSHHVMELEIIKGLARKGKPIAIGMEMFERPFQKALDEYIDGKINEKELLRLTQYFKRWGFDYALYRPILLLARSAKIPVIALNMKQEIVDKVFQGGLGSLSNAEKDSLPRQMDFSDDAYRQRLKRDFHEHKFRKGTGTFDFFYEAQILWDETMAESVAEFLRTHTDYQMIVLAGIGHLAYGSGIPKRVARRTGYDYAIILNDADLEKDIADYVLFPETIPGGTSARLMVLVRDEAGKVEVVGFPPESVSEKAGIKIGDTVLAVDHTPIHSVSDLKIELLSKQKGEKVDVKVMRESILGSGREIDFEVPLQ